MSLNAWGPASFDNEHALEWLEDLEASEDLDAIVLALSSVVEFAGTEELEPVDCCVALAAAELVAAAGGNPAKDLPANAQRFVNRMQLAVSGSVVELAQRAVDKVRTSPGMLSHWKPTGQLPEWLEVMESLEERLGDAATGG